MVRGAVLLGVWGGGVKAGGLEVDGWGCQVEGGGIPSGREHL